MGMNYYWLEKPPCDKCGSGGQERHIGKSSAGWVFALHIYPDESILGLEDWIERFKAFKLGMIRDDCGSHLTPHKMLSKILVRYWATDPTDPQRLSAQFLKENGAEPGPLGLLRSRIGGSCVGHGLGTYDHHIGEFS